MSIGLKQKLKRRPFQRSTLDPVRLSHEVSLHVSPIFLSPESTDGFAIWTHKLQEKKFDQSFVPKGCKVAPQPALTFGAGVVWDTAYEFADQHRKLIVGGDAGFIGVAGGWLQGEQRQLEGQS